jgi:hypothetical protein
MAFVEFACEVFWGEAGLFAERDMNKSRLGEALEEAFPPNSAFPLSGRPGRRLQPGLRLVIPNAILLAYGKTHVLG